MGRTRPSREDLVRRNAELKEKRKRIKEGSTLPAGQRKPGVASPAAPAARGLAAPVHPPPVPEATMAPSAPEGVPPKAASSSVKGQVPAGVEGQSDRRQEPEPEPLAASGTVHKTQLQLQQEQLSPLSVPEPEPAAITRHVSSVDSSAELESPSVSGTPAARVSHVGFTTPVSQRSVSAQPMPDGITPGPLLEKLYIKLVRKRPKEIKGSADAGQSTDTPRSHGQDNLALCLQQGKVLLEARVEGQTHGNPRWTAELSRNEVRAMQEVIEERERVLSNGALSIPVEEQLLTFRGKRLQSDHQLTDPRYGIQIEPGSVLKLTQKSLIQIAEEHKIKAAELKTKAMSRKYLKSLFDMISDDGGDSVTWQRVFEVVAGEMNQGVRAALNLKPAVDDEYRKELRKLFLANDDDDGVDFEEFVECMRQHFGDSIHGGHAAEGPAVVPLPPAIAANAQDASLNLFKAASITNVEGCPDPEWPDWTMDQAPKSAPNLLLEKAAEQRPGGIYAESVLSENVACQNVNDLGNSAPEQAMGDPRRWALVCREQTMDRADGLDQHELRPTPRSHQELRSMSAEELQ